MLKDAHAILRFLELNRHRHYWIYSAGAILASLLLIPSMIHLAIVKYNEQHLHRYAQNSLYVSNQVTFHIQQGLNLSQPSTGNLCDEQDFEAMRSVLSKYFYLSDIGRIKDNRIICTVMYGKLNTPLKLPRARLRLRDASFYWDVAANSTPLHPASPFLTRGSAITFISALYLSDINIYNQIKVEHFGGMTYDYDSGYRFSIFGDADEHDIRNVRDNDYSFSYLLPIPNQYTSTTICNAVSNLCVLALNKKLGIFRLPYYGLIGLVLFSLLVGVLLSALIDSVRSDSKLLIRKLQKAVRKNRITAVYQPKVRLDSERIVGVEALARWHDLTMGHIPPDTFIDLAERVRLINKLTKKFISNTLIDIHEILERDRNFKISFNISSELLIDKKFLDFLLQEAKKYQFRKAQIMLEVTERTSSNSQVMTNYSRKVTGQGFLISLDDFGTGFSNLAWLSTLEPHEIKVDKMFTQSIETETINNLALQGIFRLLDYLHVEVVFEGIETAQQCDYIKDKVPKAIGQGWHLFHPMTIDELEKVINHQGHYSAQRYSKTVCS